MHPAPPPARHAARIPMGWFFTLVGLSSACSSSTGPPLAHWQRSPDPTANWQRDILQTHLTADISRLRGRAELVLAGSSSGGASLNVKGLRIRNVTGPDGRLPYRLQEGHMDLALPPSQDPTSVTVDYDFALQIGFNGFLPTGSTFLWPYHCGNLFPCHPQPADGVDFTIDLLGVPEGLVAVCPHHIPNAPAYQVAWAVGPYRYSPLGSTGAGTHVGVWTYAGHEEPGLQGAAHLTAAMDWLERTLGPYPFGDEYASVEVDWGGDAFGGMEHHPFSHLASANLTSEVSHVHEAAHGWFGDGIRIACWEDFVLSEATVTYLAAHVLGQVASPELEARIWNDYASQLQQVLATNDGVAWPDSCGQVDILEDGLYSNVPYMKGAFFFRDVARMVGPDALDAALGTFTRQHMGHAMGMQSLLDHLESETETDLGPLATSWLRTKGIPDR